MNASLSMFFMKTKSISVQSSGRIVTWLHTINRGPCAILPQKTIWSRYSILLIFRQWKRITTIISIRGIPCGKRSYIQCPHQWRTSDFDQYRPLLHSFHFFRISNIFNLTEWEGMLSSRCILNMKRLATLKYK